MGLNLSNLIFKGIKIHKQIYWKTEVKMLLQLFCWEEADSPASTNDLAAFGRWVVLMHHPDSESHTIQSW